jgi:undecaprenyl-diphosphatase
MSEVLKALILGVVQGLTEFLPVSSSGHLIAMERILGFETPLAFDVSLHVATLAAILIYFCGQLVALARSPELRPVFWRVVVGTVPAGLIGVLVSKLRQEPSPWLVVGGWLISATYLLLSRGREGTGRFAEVSLPRAFLIGGSQGIAAAIPGFSRSGASIASGLWLGLERREAFRFSFLLAIPVILGAGLVEGRKLFGHGAVVVPGGWPALALAMAAAFLVGLVAIQLLNRAVTSNHFHRFGWYNLSAAVAFAIYLASVKIPPS